MNILDLHVHAEAFYAHFFKIVFNWDLENLGATDSYAEGVDLIERSRRFVVQVSATATKQKINSALSKDLSTYAGFGFKVIFIAEPNNNLRKETFTNPHGLVFNPENDIYDYMSLLNVIKIKKVEEMADILAFLRKETPLEADPSKVESNLAKIIQILSSEDWAEGASKIETIPYDIERKIVHNNLGKARELIDEYKVHYHRLAKIYSEFDRQGCNKSLSILNGIRREFLSLPESNNSDEVFFEVISKVKTRIESSGNYTPQPEEELDLCVGILVVDAFIRCKIFKNPLDT